MLVWILGQFMVFWFSNRVKLLSQFQLETRYLSGIFEAFHLAYVF